MIEFISRIGLCYLSVFVLIIFCIIYAAYHRLQSKELNLHQFNVRETTPLRGLMACLIIVTHVSFKFAETDPTWMFTSFGAPVVSMFLFLSGYGLTISFINKGMTYMNGFLSHSMLKLLPPFILASIVWIALSHIYLNGNISEMLLGFVIFRPPLPYSWFIYALIILYIYFYLAVKLSHNLLILGGVQLITTFITVVLFRIFDFDVYWYISLFAFNAGNIYATFHKKINHIIKNKPILFLLVLLCILGVMDYLKIRTGMLSIIPFGMAVPILILGGGNKFHIFNFLGTISYEIYLAHGITIPILELYDLSWGTYLMCTLASSFALAYLLHIICKHNIIPFIRNIQITN